MLPESDDKATVLALGDAPMGVTWRIVKRTGGGYEVLLRFTEPKEKAKAEMTLKTWSLPKDDEKLLKALK